jgi:hypothetical protein
MELQASALTYHFYLAKAYNYVCETFHLCLLHPKTLSIWYRFVDGNVGFSDQVVRALKSRSNAAGYRLPSAMVTDEIAIRWQVEWDGKEYVAYVDAGTRVTDDSLPAAKEALVYILVSIAECWKILVGYFLIDGLNGQERINLLNSCLSKLHES